MACLKIFLPSLKIAIDQRDLLVCVAGILVIWLKNLAVFSVKSRFIRNNPVCVNHLVPEFTA